MCLQGGLWCLNKHFYLVTIVTAFAVQWWEGSLVNKVIIPSKSKQAGFSLPSVGLLLPERHPPSWNLHLWEHFLARACGRGQIAQPVYLSGLTLLGCWWVESQLLFGSCLSREEIATKQQGTNCTKGGKVLQSTNLVSSRNASHWIWLMLLTTGLIWESVQG